MHLSQKTQQQQTRNNITTIKKQHTTAKSKTNKTQTATIHNSTIISIKQQHIQKANNKPKRKQCKTQATQAINKPSTRTQQTTRNKRFTPACNNNNSSNNTNTPQSKHKQSTHQTTTHTP